MRTFISSWWLVACGAGSPATSTTDDDGLCLGGCPTTGGDEPTGPLDASDVFPDESTWGGALTTGDCALHALDGFAFHLDTKAGTKADTKADTKPAPKPTK